jgi:hypothetical protein
LSKNGRKEKKKEKEQKEKKKQKFHQGTKSFFQMFFLIPPIMQQLLRCCLRPGACTIKPFSVVMGLFHPLNSLVVTKSLWLIL